jgi:hypothetical protein
MKVMNIGHLDLFFCVMGARSGLSVFPICAAIDLVFLDLQCYWETKVLGVAFWVSQQRIRRSEGRAPDGVRLVAFSSSSHRLRSTYVYRVAAPTQFRRAVDLTDFMLYLICLGVRMVSLLARQVRYVTMRSHLQDAGCRVENGQLFKTGTWNM